MTAVSIRGTHGSGKSTVVRTIINMYPHRVEYYRDKPKKVRGYVVELPTGVELYVVGSYVNACGGCDGIQPYADIWPMVEDAYKDGMHVLFEGALVSSSYGNIGRSSEQFGDNMVFAFLDTPLEVCLERIRQRRAAKGNHEPLNPANTTFKFDSVAKSLPKIRDEFARRVVEIDHTKAVKQVLALFGVKISREPRHE